MTTFAFINIEEVQCSKIILKKLVRNDICLLDEFVNEISNNPQYLSEYRTLLTYIEHYSGNNKLPKKKFGEIKGKKHKEFEFKSKNLRIYATQILNNRIIVIGGYKKSQSKDLNRLDAILKELNDEKTRIIK